MNLRPWFRKLGNVTFAALAVSSASLFTTSAITAQAPTTAVGTTSATQTVAVTIATTYAGGGTVSVVTQGSSTLDYALVTPAIPVVGSCASAVVFTAGSTCTVQYTFTPTRPFTRYGAASVFDGSGNLLGNAFLTGVGNAPQVSYPLNAASAFTTVGSGFNVPFGVAVDASGNVYVADSASNSIKEILASNGTTVTLATGFLNPLGVAVDGAGNVYVADAGHNAVKEILAVNGTIPATPTIVSLASGFTFGTPQGVAVDGSGNVYVADFGNHAVEQIAAVNGVIPASATPLSLGAAGSFSSPDSVAVDASGNVYVTDINKVSVSKIVAVAGAVSATSTVVSLGTGLNQPSGVAVDGSGNIYVADQSNKLVKEFLAVGGSVPTGVITIVPLGTGYTSPTGVAVDASGDVFVADGGVNNAVEELNDQTPPILTFTSSTAVGSTSTDSPKTFTLLNSGNTPLLFPAPGSGSNPVFSAGFTAGVGFTCPQVASGAASGSLAAGASCVDSVNFTPVQAGTIPGSLTATDTNLNAAAATQSVTLAGTATAGTLTVTVGSPSAVVNAASVTLTASVAFAGVAPTGSLSFSVNSGTAVAATCTGTTTPLNCTASFNPAGLTVTTYPIAATYTPADSNYTSGSGNGTLTISKGNPGLSLAPGGSSAVDASVTFVASLTPASGVVPTGGSVKFTVANGATTTLCAAVTLTAGSASCQTTALISGTNVISATYTGDTNFNNATSSNTATQTVTAATTTLAVSSPGASTVDSAVVLTATVSTTPAFSVNPTGSVKFFANGSLITGCGVAGVVTVNSASQTATCSATALVAPSDSITATYTGDSNFATSSASAYAQSMGKDNTSATIVSTLATTAVVNQTVTFTATITPTNNSTAGVTPTGSVTFTKGSGGPTLCSGAVVLAAGTNGTGTAACSTAFSTAMSSTGIFAVYAGDTNFNAANPVFVGQTVLNAPTTTALTSSPNPAAVNATATITPTVVPANSGAGYAGTALPNGSVSVFDSLASVPANAICSSTVVNGVVSTCSVIFATSGTHVLSAVFTPNDSNFVGSTSANYTQNVSTSSLTLTVSNPGSPSLTVNQAGTFAATFPAFTAGQTTPAGTVAYYDSLLGSSPIPGCSALAVAATTAAIPNCTETLSVAGTHVISATYTPSGTSSFQTTFSNQLPQVVAQSATTVAITAPTVASSVDQVVTLTATVTPTTTGPGTTLPTGTITFTAVLTAGGSTSTLCTATIAVAGGTSASCTAPFLAPGAYTISATYSGDKNFTAPGTAATRAQTVGTTGTSLGLASASLSNPASPAVNQSAIYTVQLTLANSISDTGLTIPSGSVTFKDSVTSVTCAAPISTSGQASCSFAEPTAGTHSIVATYPGDTNFGNSTNTFSESVLTDATSITSASISTNPSSPAVDQSGVVLNATVTPTFTGTALPGGTVLFSDAATGIATTTCSSAVTSGVVAPCSHVFTTAGTHTITAAYSGDVNFAAISQTNTVTVGGAGAVTLNVASSTPSITVNQSAIYTAAFSPVQTGPAYPTGSVQFYDGANTIPGCNQAVSSTGTISNCTEVMTTAGTHVISAIFTSTNSNFAATITSGNLAQVVAQNSTKSVLTAPTTTSTTDQQVTFAGTVAPGTLTPAGTGSSIPTGTMSFTYTLNGVTTTVCASNVATVASITSATCTAPFTAAGSYVVTANYNGDSNFLASTSASFPDAVGKTGTSVVLAGTALASPASPATNQSASYSVQISLPGSINDSGLTTPTGNVVFSDAATGAGCTAVVIASTGIASCSFADTVTGPHSIAASYTGDNNFSASTQTFAVTVGSTSTSVVISVNPAAPVTSQVPVSLNAAITTSNSGSALPTGTVLFTDAAGGTSSTCSSTVTSGVVAPCAHTFTTGGVHTLTAAYSGDSNFAAITQTTPFTVTAATPTVTLVSTVPTSEATQVVTFTATVTPPYTGFSPTGTVAFTSSPATTIFSACGAVTVAPASGIASASCTVTFPANAAGNYQVTATYSGDGNYKTASMAATQTVQAFTLVITVNPTSVVTSQVPVSLNATLPASNSGAALPTGTVLFTDVAAGVTSTCTSPVSSGVVAPCTHLFATAGAHTLTALYSGDGNFGSISQTTPFTVLQATPAVSVVSTVPTSVATQVVTFSTTITPPYSGVSPTGTVAFTSSPTAAVFTACAAVPVTSAAGTATATCTVTFPQATSGVFGVTATYSGDNNYKTVASAIASQSVQNFSATITPATVVLAQGNTNLTDPYLPTPITYTQAAVNGFTDQTVPTCGTGGVTGLTCTVNATTGAVVVTASLTVTPGVYPITVTTADTSVGHTTLSQTATTSVTIISRAFPGGTTIPYSIQTAGTLPVSFSVLPSLAGSTYTCNSKVANLDPAGSGNYLLGTDTLTNLGLSCSSIVAGTGTNAYTFTITAGSGTFASLEPAPIRASASRILAAGLFAPLLLALGFSRRTKKARKVLLRNLAIALLTLAALQISTGCGGGFTGSKPTSTAVVGSYLIGISNAQGATVAEIPLVVAGNQ